MNVPSCVRTELIELQMGRRLQIERPSDSYLSNLDGLMIKVTKASLIFAGSLFLHRTNFIGLFVTDISVASLKWMVRMMYSK